MQPQNSYNQFQGTPRKTKRLVITGLSVVWIICILVASSPFWGTFLAFGYVTYKNDRDAKRSGEAQSKLLSDLQIIDGQKTEPVVTYSAGSTFMQGDSARANASFATPGSLGERRHQVISNMERQGYKMTSDTLSGERYPGSSQNEVRDERRARTGSFSRIESLSQRFEKKDSPKEIVITYEFFMPVQCDRPYGPGVNEYVDASGEPLCYIKHREYSPSNKVVEFATKDTLAETQLKEIRVSLW